MIPTTTPTGGDAHSQDSSLASTTATLHLVRTFTGNNYGKVANLSRAVNMKPPAQKVYYHIQNNYAIPAVYSHWEQIRLDIIEKLQKKKDVVVAGKF